MTALLNMDDVAHEYAVPLPEGLAAVRPKVLLDTDWQRFGGSTPDKQSSCAVADGLLSATLPALSGMLVQLGA